MKFQILKIVALLNAAAAVSATTAAGSPPVSNLNRAHGTNFGTTILEFVVKPIKIGVAIFLAP